MMAESASVGEAGSASPRSCTPASVDLHPGRSYDPAPAEMWEKFEDCTGRSLPGERLRDGFDMLDGLESVGDVNDLTRLLQPTAG